MATDYPFDPQQFGRTDMDPATARRFEETVVALLRKRLVGARGRRLDRTVIEIAMEGRRPDTRLLVRYEDHVNQSQHTAHWALWRPEDQRPGSWPLWPPADRAETFISLWLAGDLDPPESHVWVERALLRDAYSDRYPWPPEEPLPREADAEQVAAWELTVFNIFQDTAIGDNMESRRRVLDGRLSRESPRTVLVVSFQDLLTGEDGTARWPFSPTPEELRVEHWDPPNAMVGGFFSAWGAGEIKPDCV